MSILNFLNDALLKMTWLDQSVQWLLKHGFNLDETSYLFKAVNFFIYDVIKIFILLSILIYISSYIQAKFTPERTREILKHVKGLKGNIIGALMGTVTPFCSCSSIPVFIGFTKAGLPIGVTFSFLISSPLVDMASIILLASIFGVEIALLYVLSGIMIAVIGGSLIDALNLQNQVESFVYEGPSLEMPVQAITRKDQHRYAREQVVSVFKKVWIYVLLGVFIGALIHGYIPQVWIETVLGDNNPFSVILATLAGIPMYADIFGALPIAEALVSKGVGIGTVLAFMMAITALSFPSIMMLKRVVKPKLLLIFIAIVTLGIIMTGYTFNLL